jgi:protein-disulfide isomerase
MTRRLSFLTAVTAAFVFGAAALLAVSAPAGAADNAAAPAAAGGASKISKAGAAAMMAEAGGLSDDQRAEVEAIIKNYLIAHPEIIRDAINELQRREDAAAAEQQSKAIAENKSALFDSGRGIVFGNPKGDVTLVEFFDYNCTYCRRAQADMKQLIAKDPNLRIVMKQFPVLGDGSVEAAQVGIAVHMIAPDRYFDFHDAMLGEHGQVNGERALAVAESIGLDPVKIKEAMKAAEVKATIGESYDLAAKLQLSGTPSYVTAKEVIVGAIGFDALKEKIGQARCGAATC